jgi:hypothetical protein
VEKTTYWSLLVFYASRCLIFGFAFTCVDHDNLGNFTRIIFMQQEGNVTASEEFIDFFLVVVKGFLNLFVILGLVNVSQDALGFVKPHFHVFVIDCLEVEVPDFLCKIFVVAFLSLEFFSILIW